MEEGVRRLGVHTSIAGGVHLSLERARELGCTTVQLFSHNPRSWRVAPAPEERIEKFRELRAALDIHPVFIHTSYLINLSSASSDIREKSIRLLIHEMDSADSLGADYVVLHTGSASRDDEDTGRRRAVEALTIVSRKHIWQSRLLLENTAGERGDISSRIIDLAEIMEKTKSAAIGGICLDTCHAFQAGYDISKEEGVAEIAGEIRRYMGPEKVKLIHLNDSKRAFNSRVDRHEHIGSGAIGMEGLGRFIHHPAFRHVPLILETPKKSDDDDPRNLKMVRRLLGLPGTAL
jgi:deoxyribonuclease-4